MQSLKQVKLKAGQIVLLRADFNVPIVSGRIKDTFRIDKTLPTIDHLRAKKARIFIVSHLGSDGKESLKPVFSYLKKKYKDVAFAETIDGAYEKLSGASPGGIVLLENLRAFPGETANDARFGQELAVLADFYVNDAFSVSHRKHASIMRPPEYLPAYAGFQLEAEVKNLSGVMTKPAHPFVFILGGAKFDTKLPLIKKFLKIADTVFIGGALANNFFRALGYEVGESLVDDDTVPLLSLLKNKTIVIPADVVAVEKGEARNCGAGEVYKKEKILDIGTESTDDLIEILSKAKTVLWNGPLGWYEGGYDGATKKILKALAKQPKTKTIIGGGDTALLVNKMKLEDKLGFVSTGGGAALEFLAKGSLPGIKVLEQEKK